MNELSKEERAAVIGQLEERVASWFERQVERVGDLSDGGPTATITFTLNTDGRYFSGPYTDEKVTHVFVKEEFEEEL